VLAALDAKTGLVIGECHLRHRAKEFIQFLKRIEAALTTDPQLRRDAPEVGKGRDGRRGSPAHHHSIGLFATAGKPPGVVAAQFQCRYMLLADAQIQSCHAVYHSCATQAPHLTTD
jgi:hypothetical protein